MPIIKPDNQPLTQEEKSANAKAIDLFLPYVFPALAGTPTETAKKNRKREERLFKILVESLANEHQILLSNIPLIQDKNNSPLFPLFELFNLAVIKDKKPQTAQLIEREIKDSDDKEYQSILRHLGTNEQIEDAILEAFIDPIRQQEEREKQAQNPAADNPTPKQEPKANPTPSDIPAVEIDPFVEYMQNREKAESPRHTEVKEVKSASAAPTTFPPEITPVKPAPEIKEYLSKLSLNDLIKQYIAQKKSPLIALTENDDSGLFLADNVKTELENIKDAIISKMEALKNRYDLDTSEETGKMLAEFLQLTKDDTIQNLEEEAPLEDHAHRLQNQEIYLYAIRLRDEFEHHSIEAMLEKIDALPATTEADDFLKQVKDHNHFRYQLNEIKAILEPDNLMRLEKEDYIVLMDYIRKAHKVFQNAESLKEAEEDSDLRSFYLQITTEISSLQNARMQLKIKLDTHLISKNYFDILDRKIGNKIEELNFASKKISHCIEQIDAISKESVEEVHRLHYIEEQLNHLKPRDESKAIQDEQSPVSTILYLIIMTRKDLILETPTREYLNRLYSDPDILDFLESDDAKAKAFKQTIADLEENILKINAKQISDRTLEMWDKIIKTIAKPEDRKIALKKYIDDQSSLIQQELLKLNNHPDAQAKCAEHWIKTLALATQNNDYLLAVIIYDALTLDPKYQIEQEWISRLPISSEAFRLFGQQKDFMTRQPVKEYVLTRIEGLEIRDAKSPEDLQRNRNKARGEISGVINEVYSYHIKFSLEMKSLQEHFQEIKDVLGNVDKPADEYQKAIQACTSTQFSTQTKEERKAGADDVTDLSVIVSNIGMVAKIFNSQEFLQEFDATALGAINFEWVSKYQKDLVTDPLHKNYNHLKKNPAEPLVADQLIKPVQRNPRTILLIKELLNQIDKLNKVYNNPTPEIQKKLQDLKILKSALEARQEFFNRRMIDLNARLTQAGVNRKIAYILRKHLKHNTSSFNEEFKRLDDATNPPPFSETCAILIKISKKFNTSKYITEMCVAEAARLNEKMQALDPNEVDYKLKKLNYEIAIHLLSSTKGLSVSTQEKIIDFAKLLSNPHPHPMQPHEIIAGLESVHQTKIEKLKNHRLYHRNQIIKVLGYLKEGRENLYARIERETKTHAKSDFSEDKLLYLTALVEEWKAEGAAHKFTSTEVDHNNARIKLVSDAIAFIKEFQDKDLALATAIYNKLLVQLPHTYDINASSLSNETGVAANKLLAINHLIETSLGSSPIVLPPHEDNFQFSEFCKTYITQKKDTIKAAIEQANSDYETTPISREAFAKLLSDYLECIRDEWKIKELTDPTMASHPHVTERSALIDTAIHQLQEKPVPPDPRLPDIEKIISDFSDELESKSTRSSDISAKLSYLVTSRSASEKQLDALYEESQLSKQDIQTVFESCDAIKAGLNEEKSYQTQVKEHEKKIVELKPKDEFIHGIELKTPTGDRKIGVSHLLEGFNKEVTKTLPTLFIKRHLPKLASELKEDPLTQVAYKSTDRNWKFDTEGKTADLPNKAEPSIAGNKPNYPGVTDGTYKDYVNNTWNTRIREERHGNYVQISIIEKPAEYKTHYTDAERYQSDIASAEEAVRMWVFNCGNSVEETIDLSDNPDKNLMEALILVCKANDLKFRLPSSSRYKYDFVPDHTKIDATKLSDLRDAILHDPDRAIKVKPINPADLTALEADHKQLVDHYQSKYDRGEIKEDEHKKYQAELDKINSLVVNAKNGVFSATAINKAIEKLERDKAELKIEPPPPPARRP